ncbi:L-aspartate oxidase [Candidatus Hakubella thermalkaliphila]|uniref:L-aspartate oxidase n=2 Tax=Candidatus Hakubella thermalkaliphila TaxID=2754717 RepID=A0A6V8PN95_9ACTN|nr:L-aspartate oxidase [Candidatus Hakubella thermalkaliphila]
MSSRYLIDLTQYHPADEISDVIVVGSGIAGLSLAIRVGSFANVRLITKSELQESATWYAQGGIAAALNRQDNWRLHFQDTIRAGQGLCDPQAVEFVVKEAPAMIGELMEMGTTFDMKQGKLSLATEGGHSRARVVHAGGDATGAEVERSLVRSVRKNQRVTVHERTLVVDILTDRDGSCCGVATMDTSTGELRIYLAKVVVLATGGVGQMYQFTSNPSVCTGDGIAMAYRAGAIISDMEFVQFHPTVFQTKRGESFLITEAVRGEGAFLRDKKGDRFMLGKHPLAELGPRDVVVREIVEVMERDGTDHIYLDARHIARNVLEERFPTIVATLQESGVDFFTELIQVSPAAHYLIGGVKTNLDGETSVSGLYACGETACTGVHGANRLASNSLLEGLVFARRIAQSIKDSLSRLKPKMPQGSSEGSSPSPGDISGIESKKNELEQAMMKKAGIVRDCEGLEEAETFIQESVKSTPCSKDPRTVEFINMLTSAWLTVKAAQLRCESRGVHLRRDYPYRDDINWKKHILMDNQKIGYEDVAE